MLHSSQDHLGTRTHDLDHPVLAVAKSTDSWHAGKGDLQRAFLLDVLMVPSSALAIAADGERLSCGGFSLGETIRFESLEFITNRFDGLSPPPHGGWLRRHRQGLNPRWATILAAGPNRDSTEEFHMALDGEGRINLPSP
jgi:hypothetical protein